MLGSGCFQHQNGQSTQPGSSERRDPVFIKNHDREDKLEPRYLPHFRITKILSDRQVEVMAPDGARYRRNIQDVHYQYPATSIARSISEAEAFGRSAKTVYHPHTLENSHWKFTKQPLPPHRHKDKN